MAALKLSILFPVRVEGVNLKVMLKVLRSVVNVPHEVLVVYDDPTDKSIAIVNGLKKDDANLVSLHNDGAPGIVNAIKAGVKASKGEYILIFAADEVGSVIIVNDMVDLMDQGCEFVSCTRYSHGGRRLGGSSIGGFLSKASNKIFNWISSSRLSDATTGMKMFRRDLFDQFNLVSKPIGWAVAFEMAIKAQLLDLKLGEIPIVSIGGPHSEGKESGFITWFLEYGKWFIWGARSLRTKKKTEQDSIARKIPAVYG